MVRSRRRAWREGFDFLAELARFGVHVDRARVRQRIRCPLAEHPGEPAGLRLTCTGPAGDGYERWMWACPLCGRAGGDVGLLKLLHGGTWQRQRTDGEAE